VDKVLVKKGISAQYPVGAGGPIMVMGGGGRSGGGRTKRQRLGGALGGLVGVAGALTGQHRSLGGLTQSMISGGAQGRQLGESVGRGLSGRSSRASADLKDKRRQAEAERKTLRGEGITSVTAPIDSYNRRVAVRNDEALEQANRTNPMASFAQMTDPNAPKDAMTGLRVGVNRMLDESEYDSLPEMIKLPPVRVENVPLPKDSTTQLSETTGAKPDRVDMALNAINNLPPSQRVAVTNNSAPPPQNGAGAEATADAGLENTANYGGEAIDDKIDVEEGPQGSSSATPENQVKVMNNPQQIRAARRKVEDREQMME
jgi:hypothetical protein